MARTQINPSLSSGLTTFASPTNILDNGGFEIWQRGTSFSSNNPGTGGYVITFGPDRWKLALFAPGGSSITGATTQVAGVMGNAANYAFTVTGTSSGFQVQQYVENYTFYAGLTLTLTAWVKTSLTGIQIAIGDNVVGGQSVSHPGDGNWHQLTATFTATASPAALVAQVLNTTTLSNGSVAVDSAMLVLGSTAANFVPLHPQVDLQRCYRYYFDPNSRGSSGGQYIAVGWATSSTGWTTMLRYPTQMHANPTISVTQTGAFVSTTGGLVQTTTASTSGGDQDVNINGTVASGLTTNQPLFYYSNNGVQISADI